MLPMIPLEVDEVIAMGQFMAQAKRKGEKSLWKAFWLGGAVEGEGDDERTPPLQSLPERPREVLLASIWGMSFPCTLVRDPRTFGARRRRPRLSARPGAGALRRMAALRAVIQWN
jgi:hypothetical protein